ncbi:unnamed protein product [Cladocopium goreaui]|uniref:Neurofilament heavy polypeptide n=1 Tax=Cladocopium goreaui TaxID=2562237 RepID=A0A9P1FV23_9DINO|nr:unnamed protein product [Cladocopium goreaui]
MGPVDEILQRAADRSKRRAELEVAKGMVERFSGYELADDQFGWLSVERPPGNGDDSRGSALGLQGQGASSTATTIPADDAEALANAVNDYEAAKKAQETHPAPPKPKPGIVRVNSVPVLAPVTPVDKIRRTMTPSPVEDPPAVPAQPPPPVQAPPAPATTLSEEKPDGSNPPMSGSRRVKKRGKKVKKTAKTNTENTGTAAAASDQVRHEASLAPSHSGEATRPSEPHAPLESQPARVQPEPTPGSAPVQPKPTPQSAPAQPKPAAKKALAKPPKRVHDNQPGSEATCAEMVKAQATPQGREALYREAVHEALQRLGTEQQFTPAETISPGSVRKPPAQEPDDDDDDNATQHYEAQDDSNIDFEEALDRAIKKEPTEAEEGCNQLVVPEAQQQGRDCPPEMKKAFDKSHYCTAKLQLLQDAWTACAGEWRRSELYLKIVESRKTSAHGARVWLTEPQIAAKYSSPEMAREICQAKLSDPELSQTHTKAHPDCPSGMRLYLVWDSEGISETTDTVVEDIFQCVDDSDSEAPRKKSLVKRKREPSSSTKSSKESSEEESASSSDRKAFRCDIIYSIIILYEEEWLASTACHCLEISQ